MCFHACRNFPGANATLFCPGEIVCAFKFDQANFELRMSAKPRTANKKGRLPSFSRKAGPGFSPLNRDQNWYRSANWIKRGFIEVAVINPKFGELG